MAIRCDSRTLRALLFGGALVGGSVAIAQQAGPDATIGRLMDVVIVPASDALFSAAGDPPTSDKGWAAVRSHAASLVESGTRLATDARAGGSVWMSTSKEMIAAGLAAMRAAEAKSADRLSEAGDRMVATCEHCHERYLEKQEQNGPAMASREGPAAPRRPDGLPDLQGIWQALNTAAWDIEDHHASAGVPAGRGVVEGADLPYQPWALARKRANAAERKTADPVNRCELPGVPRIMYMPFPFQIVQTPTRIALLYEYAHAVRIVYTDGTPHPDAAAVDFWMGDSRGRYEGDTLVVDVANFNDKTWFDAAGNFHSEALHLVERFTRIGPDHIKYEVTVDDPKVFARPWNMSMVLHRRTEPNAEILEYECYADALEPVRQ